MGQLRPAFSPDGTITAGSSSPISDGAAAVVVMSRAKAEELGLDWLAEIGAHGVVAGPDCSLHEQPSNAIAAACAKEGLAATDLDLVEINEAFAAVGIASTRTLGIDPEKVNVNGGAIALGHPIGMSGARIVLHLALELRRRGGGTGAAALCGGGGQGDALIIRVPAGELSTSPVSRRPDVADLVGRARRGEQLAVARLISLVEDPDRWGQAVLREMAVALAPHTGRAHVVGLTGPPGVGKSTTTSGLVRMLRMRGRRVGVLAVDPSSPFSGGALLGDRVRMGEHATDEGVFIRSMATRGHLGGLAWSTPQALRVLDAAGCDVVVVETVGVGQAEVEVVALADTTVVLLAPGAGDEVQAAKAGILEVADVVVVNKADRDGAEQTVHDLLHAVSLEERAPDGWTRPVVRTVATRREGVADLVAALDAHREWIDARGERARRRLARARAEITALTLHEVRVRIGDLAGERELAELAARVSAGELDPYRATDELMGRVGPA